jgi:hypothetical protein
MRLNHLLAADLLGKPIDAAKRSTAERMLAAVGFVRDGERLVLDETHPWVSLEEHDGLWHVHAESRMPEHLFDTAVTALDAVAREVGLVRLDPFSRREITSVEWARRVAEESRATLRRGL